MLSSNFSSLSRLLESHGYLLHPLFCCQQHIVVLLLNV
jgi:hypothetical protein